MNISSSASPVSSTKGGHNNGGDLKNKVGSNKVEKLCTRLCGYCKQRTGHYRNNCPLNPDAKHNSTTRGRGRGRGVAGRVRGKKRKVTRRGLVDEFDDIAEEEFEEYDNYEPDVFEEVD